jgi:ribulose-5-phosphate 4-epimerase/fuculose-1-phosphate aldolase
VLLRNHGVAVVGGSIAEAVVSAIMLENAAMVQLTAQAAGDPAPEFPAAEIEKLKADLSRPEQFAINFDYLVRRVKGGGTR